MALTMDWNDLLADLPRYVQGSLKTKCAIANCSRQFFNYSEESITSISSFFHRFSLKQDTSNFT